MTEKESTETLVRIFAAAEEKVKAEGGSMKDFKKFLNTTPNYIPQVIVAAIADTQNEMLKAMKSIAKSRASQKEGACHE